jgi:hypothetical protein
MGQRLGRLAAGTVLGLSAFAGLSSVAIGPVWAYGPKPATGAGQSSTPTTAIVTPAASAASPVVSSQGNLAFTGTDAVLTATVGAGAVASGGLLLLASRKRRAAAN